MKTWPIVWSNLRRRKLRTGFTVASILVAFLLFGYLAAIRLAFSGGVELAGVDRLVTRTRRRSSCCCRSPTATASRACPASSW